MGLRGGIGIRSGTALVVAFGLMLAACGGDDDAKDNGDATTTTESGAEDTTTTDPEPTTAPPGTPEEQALAVYAAANDYLERAVGSPQTIDLTEIGNYYSGSALFETSDIINGVLADNTYQRLETISKPIIETGGDAEIVLTDCFVEVSTDFDQATGQPVSSEGRHVINLRVWVRLIDGAGWRVDEIHVEDAPCTP